MSPLRMQSPSKSCDVCFRSSDDLLPRGIKWLCRDCRHGNPLSVADVSSLNTRAFVLAEAIRKAGGDFATAGRMSDADWDRLAKRAYMVMPTTDVRYRVAVILYQNALRVARVSAMEAVHAAV